MEALRLEVVRLAARPVLAAEAGAGQANRRAGGDDQHEHHRVRPARAAGTRLSESDARRTRGERLGAGFHALHCSPQLRPTPAPSSTAPTRARKSACARELGLERQPLVAPAARRAARPRSAGRRRARRARARRSSDLDRRVLAVVARARGRDAGARRLERAVERGQARRVEHDPHAAARRHLVRMAEQPEARHVGDRVRREARAARRPRRGSACASSAPPRPGRRDRASRRRARAPCRAASSGRARRRAARRTSARSRRARPCRRRRARTSARRRGSCGRRRGSRPRRAPAGRRRRRSRARPRSAAPRASAATESASSGAPPIANTSFSAFVAAIVAEVVRVVDDRREEVDREHERALVVELVDRGVVGGVEPDEQVLGLGGHEAAQQLLEPRGRVLRGAAACGREIGELHHARP